MFITHVQFVVLNMSVDFCANVRVPPHGLIHDCENRISVTKLSVTKHKKMLTKYKTLLNIFAQLYERLHYIILKEME